MIQYVLHAGGTRIEVAGLTSWQNLSTRLNVIMPNSEYDLGKARDRTCVSVVFGAVEVSGTLLNSSDVRNSFRTFKAGEQIKVSCKERPAAFVMIEGTPGR